MNFLIYGDPQLHLRVCRGEGGNMKIMRRLMIAVFVIGTGLATEFPSGAAQGTVTETAPKVGADTSSTSAGTGSKNGQGKKKRRSSGKGIVEETTQNRSQPKAPDSRESTPGTTLKFGSGGGGVSGATGK